MLTQDPDTKNVRFVAEDLGVITPDVEELRDRFAFPGIRVLQFGFGDDDFYDGRPWAFRKTLSRIRRRTTTRRSWAGIGANRKARAAMSRPGASATNCTITWAMCRPDYAHFALIRLAMATPADTVIIPVQDVLGLGNVARMNTPGQPQGNWQFRLRSGQLDDRSLDHLHHLTRLYARTSR